MNFNQDPGLILCRAPLGLCRCAPVGEKIPQDSIGLRKREGLYARRRGSPPASGSVGLLDASAVNQPKPVTGYIARRCAPSTPFNAPQPVRKSAPRQADDVTALPGPCVALFPNTWAGHKRVGHFPDPFNP